MAQKVALSTLNASTYDILNVIRENASYEYQSQIPIVNKVEDVRAVGQILAGAPALNNQFINALVNRIAFVAVQSATFNNPYKDLKKGYLEYGETIEDIFVGIANAVVYDDDKAEQREFKITKPDVHSVFHIMNWRVFYPVTINKDEIKRAFLSVDGVTDLISRIVEQVYTAAEYDEFLLFKYLIIKGVTHGASYPVPLGTNNTMNDAAVEFRSISNVLPFMSNKYNQKGVRTSTPRDRQLIFMDAKFNAQFDVNVLASAFNMDRADFLGRLKLIDDFSSFDNERFEQIRAVNDAIEEVTADELALMKDVKAIIVDENWFQVYDNENEFTEKYVASGLYWNYFYHTWKTISFSPFANIVSFVARNFTSVVPTEFTATVASKDVSDYATVLTFEIDDSNEQVVHDAVRYVQTDELVTAGIAVQPYGAVIIPANKTAEAISMEADINGTRYEVTEIDGETDDLAITGTTTVGTTLTFTIKAD